MSSDRRNKRNYGQVESNGDENFTPSKRVSFGTPLVNVVSIPPKEENIDKMAGRLLKRTYDSLIMEIKTKPRWDSKTFQDHIFRDLRNCAFEGQKVAAEYERVKKNFSKAEDEISKLNERIQDLHQRTYEAEEMTEQKEQECDAKKEELDAAHTIIDKNQYKIRLLQQENAKLKEELIKEKEERKIAEKNASDAKIAATEDRAKMIAEKAKSSVDDMQEKLNALMKKLVELQDLTETDVKQGVQNLTKSLSTLFQSSEKKDGPSWMVKKEICESIMKNAQEDFDQFISSYLNELFKWGELILPENLLDKHKISEAHSVMFQYFKAVNEEQQLLFKKSMKKTLEKLRFAGRQKITAMVRRSPIIGFTPDGISFFYSNVSNGKLNPYIDRDFLHELKVNSYSDHYGIPEEYAEADFLMIVENTVNGIAYHRIDPKSKYRQQVYCNGRSAKKRS